MRCYYHHDVPAVAVCKSCSRGLCPDCAADLGQGVACRNRCESDVRSLQDIIARNKTAYQKTRDAYVRNAVFYLVPALLCLAAGLSNWRGYSWVLTPAGLLFAFAAYLQYSTARKFE